MKRLLTALTIASSLVFVAMPAFAAPQIVSKRQLVLPTVPSNLLRQFRDKEQSYSYKDAAGNSVFKTARFLPVTPRLFQELHCSGTIFRYWHIALDSDALTQKIGSPVNQIGLYGVVLQASRDGKDMWMAPTYGATDYLNGLVECSGNSVLVKVFKNHTQNFLKASFENFTRSTTWTDPVYPAVSTHGRYDEIEIDGVRQFPGFLAKGNQTILGDSRVIVLGSSAEGIHRLPWYRDLRTAELGNGEILLAEFYRLSDGYGVKEATYITFNPVPIATKFFRIRDGEAAFTEVSSLPVVKQVPDRFVRLMDSGLALFEKGEKPPGPGGGVPLPQGRGLLLHGVPKAILDAGRMQNKNIDVMVKHTADGYLVRYIVTPTSGPTQYWEAVIQK